MSFYTIFLLIFQLLLLFNLPTAFSAKLEDPTENGKVDFERLEQQVSMNVRMSPLLPIFGLIGNLRTQISGANNNITKIAECKLNYFPNDTSKASSNIFVIL